MESKYDKKQGIDGIATLTMTLLQWITSEETSAKEAV